MVLDKKAPYWINIDPYQKTKNVKLITMEIPEPGLVQYKYEVNGKGYEAVDIREGLSKLDYDPEQYFGQELLKENTEYQIRNIKTRDLKDANKAVYLSAEIKDKSLSVVNGDFIYLSPFVDNYLSTNPFNDKDRYLPIDFYYPFEEAYILNLKIPEGYEIVELPVSVNLATEGQKGTLKLHAKHNDGELQLRINFKIKDPFFQAHEYSLLREIYDRYIEKREEQIVLKKKDG